MSHELWTDPFLEAMRGVGDPPADEAIEAIFSHGDVAAVNRLLDGLVRNDGVPSAGLPPTVRDYLAARAAIPRFDAAAVASAQDLFVRRGPEILSALGFYALPASYAARRGAQVLHRTGYMSKRPARRVFETVQMVVDVLSPGGLAPEGRGVRTAQKVRLMHAAIRRLLRHDPARPWDDELGVPINQEDLAGTLMTFSLLVLEGLERLGLELSSAEREGYLHTWMGVGRILGVRGELLPASVAEARELTVRIYRRQVEGSPEGRALLAALVEGYEGLLPSESLSGAPRMLIRYFLDPEPITGRDIAGLLGLDDGGLAVPIVRAAMSLVDLAGMAMGDAPSPAPDPSPDAGMARELGLVTTRAILLIDRGGSRAPFHVPEDLQDSWWSRSQGEDAPPASLGSRIAAVVARGAGSLATSAVLAATPRWNTVGRWRDLLFASWPLPAHVLRPLVPPELELDLFEGQAWITLVPMRMEDVRWVDLPAITGAPALTELNLRTYVRRGGRRGVSFLSIDVDSAWIEVVGSAFLALPTTLARMTFERQGDRVRFESERVQEPGAPGASLACTSRVTGAPAALVPGTLEAFLVERSSMFFARSGRVIRGDIRHEPWEVAPVEAVFTVNTVAAAAGLSLPERAPHLLFAAGSDTVVMPLEEDD